MTISRRTLLERLGAGVALAVAAPRLAAAGLTGDAAALAGTRPGGAIRLHRNESAHGPSSKVIAALVEATKRTAGDYPDAAVEALRRKIARTHGIRVEQLVLGCGSAEILRMAIAAFAGQQKRVLTAVPTFEAVGAYAQRAGSDIVGVRLSKNWSHDVTAMPVKTDASIGLVYVCNPNNPTGSLTPRQDLEGMIRTLPPHVYVVIDEAYHDYVGHTADYASFIERPVDNPRVIVLRSFSKIHGLAGLRVGYAVTSAATARALASHRLSDGVNALGARAAAAALDDVAHVRKIVEANENDRQEFLNEANARMLRSVDSLTNFVMLNAGRPAAAVVQHFASHGILVAGPVPGFENYVRVSLGTVQEMREFWRVWDLQPGGGHHM
jgi:histidinol-phosphate aminotransferase